MSSSLIEIGNYSNRKVLFSLAFSQTPKLGSVLAGGEMTLQHQATAVKIEPSLILMPESLDLYVSSVIQNRM